MAEGHGGVVRVVRFQPPRAGFHQRSPSLSEEGSFGTYVAVYSSFSVQWQGSTVEHRAPTPSETRYCDFRTEN